MNINSKAKGFVCGAVAAATYGMNPLFTLPLYKEGMSVDSVLFYRYGFAVLILGILMKVQGQSFAFCSPFPASDCFTKGREAKR